jgi:hypothetical protein
MIHAPFVRVEDCVAAVHFNFTLGDPRMIYGQLLRIALLLVGLLSAVPGIALAGSSNQFPSDFATQIPEPGTLTLLASGAAALGGVGWLRRRKK